MTLFGSIWTILSIFALALLVSRMATVPIPHILRQLRPLFFLSIVLIVVQSALRHPLSGALAGARMCAIAAVAAVFSATTSHAALVQWIDDSLLKVRFPARARFGFSLAVGIAIRSIDHLGVVAVEVLDARRARGLDRSLRAFAQPLIVSAAMYAHGIGEALDARGISEPDHQEGDSA